MALADGHDRSRRPRHQRYSTFIVELPNPGYVIKRDIGTYGRRGPAQRHIMGGGHAEIDDQGPGGPGREPAGRRGARASTWASTAWPTAACATACTISPWPSGRWTWPPPMSSSARPSAGSCRERQGVQWMLADCASELYMARLMLLHIAYKAERGTGPAAGELHRQGVPGPHGPQSGRHRHPAPRGARLLHRHAASPLVHPHPLAAAGGRTDEVHRWTVGRNVIKAWWSSSAPPLLGGWRRSALGLGAWLARSDHSDQPRGVRRRGALDPPIDPAVL